MFIQRLGFPPQDALTVRPSGSQGSRPDGSLPDTLLRTVPPPTPGFPQLLFVPYFPLYQLSPYIIYYLVFGYDPSLLPQSNVNATRLGFCLSVCFVRGRIVGDVCVWHLARIHCLLNENMNE